ncbi:MAG TPA: tetratricopeptide repeat protein [Polyangia bacterium]
MPDTSVEGRRGPPPLPRDATAEASPAAAPGLPEVLDSTPLVELAGLLAREAEAPGEARRRADLLMRLAMLCWDVLDDPEAAAQYLMRAGADHPQAARLRLAMALGQRDRQDLSAVYDEIAAVGERGADVHREFAELWLYGQEDPGHAAAALRTALSQDAADPEARELAAVALAAAGQWAELIEHARAVPDDDAAALLEAAHLLGDRAGDVPAAARAVQQALALEGNDLYIIERLLELAGAGAGAEVDLEALLRRKIALLSSEPRAQGERAACLFELAGMVETRGELGEAQQILAELGRAGVPFAPLLVLHARRRLAARQQSFAELVEVYRDLRQAVGHPQLALGYGRRIAELLDARLAEPTQAEALYAEVAAAEPANLPILHALERLRLGRGALAEVAAQQQAAATLRPDQRGRLLRRAAIIRERLGELEPAAQLRHESLGAGAAAPATSGPRPAGSPDDFRGWSDLARLYRRIGDRGRLITAYRNMALLAGDSREGGLMSAMTGAVQLALGQLRDAEASLREAVTREPADAFARGTLVALYRMGARWRELCDALAEFWPLLVVEKSRAALLCEIGRVAREKVSDARLAREAYEKALEICPGDAGALHALAQILGEQGDPERAVELREAAVLAAGDSPRAAAILLEIGELCERQLKDDERARHAYERALQRDERAVEVLRALAQLHRKAKRTAELLDVLRRELAQTTDTQRALALHLEIARNADGFENDADAALRSYGAALAIDPGNAPALAGAERLCRRDGRHEDLVEILGRLPRSQRILRSLGEALEKLGRHAELSEVRVAELALLEDRKDVARAARGLAALYEEKLGDKAAAARYFRQASEAESGDLRTLHELQRLLEETGQHADLEEALARELGRGPDPARRAALLLQLGELRRGPLAQPAAAAEAFEAVVAQDPSNLTALRALAEIYAKSGAEQDLLRVIDRTAKVVDDPAARAELLQRRAELCETRGDADAAIETLREAFDVDPSNRGIFTSLERLCYKREKWTAALALYEEAIRLVEGSAIRAYRLGDLYGRRGQLQLQYLNEPGEAAASYLKVIELDPDNDTALKVLEGILSRQGDWKGLIAAYELRAEHSEDQHRRLETLRRAARVAAAKLKDLAEAARLYGRIHEVNPADREAQEALERYYERTRDWDHLITVLSDRLSRTQPGEERIAIYLRLGRLCEEGLRDVDQAVQNYRQILETTPNHREALEALARIHEATERWTEFVDITRRQIRITTDRQAKALLYFKCGSVMEAKFQKDDDAIRYYDAAIKTSPSCLPAVHGLRDLHLRRKDWAKVIESLELEVKLWQDDKERAGVFAHMGQIYGEHLDDMERAIQYFESALAVDAESLPANRALFDLYYRRGDWQRAAPLAAALAQKGVRDGEPAERSDFYLKRGVVARETLDHRSAAENFVIALEIRPDNLEALDALTALGRQSPGAYDFLTVFRELEKVYRRREHTRALARVQIGYGTLREKEFDVELAEQAYRDAVGMCQDEVVVATPLVDLLVVMRRFDEARRILTDVLERDLPKEQKTEAYLKLAEISSDALLDPHSSAEALRALLAIDADHREAHYRLAQDLYLLGEYEESKRVVARLIDLSTQPGRTVAPEELARYYYYFGRIFEAGGDLAGASSRYRRALELDPAYPPAALALAKKAAHAADRHAAEVTLTAALRAASERSPRHTLIMRRALAQLHLAAGDREGAVRDYRALLDIEDNSDDRVALAEVYARDLSDLGNAIGELNQVLTADLRHAPTYRMLVQLYERANERDRVSRILTVLDMLGYAEEAERQYLGGLRQRAALRPRVRGLSDDLREQFLLPAAAQVAFREIYGLVREPLLALYPVTYVGENPQPLLPQDNPGLGATIAEMLRLFNVDADVVVATRVPSGALSLEAQPKPVVVLDRTFLDLPDAERRFLLGRCFDPLRSGLALPIRLAPSQRREVGGLLVQLLLPEGQREPGAAEFARALPRKVLKALEKVSVPGGALPDPEGWFTALASACDRAGLFAADDIGAALRMIARLAGEEFILGSGGELALGAVGGGADLVRFYLSDAYHRLQLAVSPPVA